MQTLTITALCFACLGYCALISMRLCMRSGDEPPLATVALAHLAAICAAPAGLLGGVLLARNNGWLSFGTGWHLDLLAGATAGILLYVVFAAVFRFRSALVRWACRQSNDEETIALRLYTELGLVLGSIVIFAFTSWAWGLGHRHGVHPMLLVGLITLFPFYLTMALPWLRYFRSPSLQLSAAAGVDLTEVREWLDEVSAKRRRRLAWVGSRKVSSPSISSSR